MFTSLLEIFEKKNHLASLSATQNPNAAIASSAPNLLLQIPRKRWWWGCAYRKRGQLSYNREGPCDSKSCLIKWSNKNGWMWNHKFPTEKTQRTLAALIPPAGLGGVAALALPISISISRDGPRREDEESTERWGRKWNLHIEKKNFFSRVCRSYDNE